MKISPVCLAACAAIVFAPVPASAKAKCSRNAEVLNGSMLTLNANGEWCEMDSKSRTQFVRESETQHKSRLAAEQRAEIAYLRAVARYENLKMGAANAGSQIATNVTSDSQGSNGSNVPFEANSRDIKND